MASVCAYVAHGALRWGPVPVQPSLSPRYAPGAAWLCPGEELWPPWCGSRTGPSAWAGKLGLAPVMSSRGCGGGRVGLTLLSPCATLLGL